MREVQWHHVLWRELNTAMPPVYWIWNRRAWVTQEIFLDCFMNYLCPTVRMSYQPWLYFPWTMSLGHHEHPAEARTPVDISVVYMPSNTTSLFQPMHQRVIATFKAYYLCHTFIPMARVVDRSEGTHLTIRRALTLSWPAGHMSRWSWKG